MTGLDTQAEAQALTPTPPKDRIATLDLIRGLAILGILAVNAAGFAVTFAGYSDAAFWPFPNEGLSAVCKWIVDAFFHQKFISLFSMLFGVSLFLVGGERQDRARGRLLRRRLFWLAVIALVHGLALWWGDVLLLYAWSGLLVMFARSWRPGRLFGVGLVLFGLFAALQIVGMMAIDLAPPEQQARIAAQMTPSPARIAEVQEQYRLAGASLAGAYRQNLADWIALQAPSVLGFVVPTAGLMMIGLGLFKTGFFTGAQSRAAYVVAAAIGLAALAAVGWIAWSRDIAGAEWRLGHGVEFALNPVAAVGYAALLILAWKAGAASVLGPLAAAGRMALTNYLLQSLIMTSLFWGGRGLGLMGQVDRPTLWLIVIVIWIVQLIGSTLWLKAFAMGPAEWVWRRLTYGGRVPIRRTA